MSVNSKLKWKRALSRLRFCYDELEYTRESAKAAGPKFEEFYRKFCAEKGISIYELDCKNEQRLSELYGSNKIADNNTNNQPDIHSPGNTAIIVHNDTPSSNSEYTTTADDIAMHEAFSKLFKQIALKLHPDRIDKTLSDNERELRISMFQQANQAFEEKKYYFLLDLADRYNITVPKNYEQQTRWMKRESQRIVALVDKEKNTYNYGFAEAETDEQREQLIKKFMFQLFRIRV